MTFDPSSQLDASQVGRRGAGGGGGLKIGGGIGGILVVIVASLIFGPEVVGGMLGTGQSFSTYEQEAQGTGGNDELATECRTGQDANEQTDCRVVGTVNSLNDFWEAGVLAAVGTSYRAPNVALTSGSWETGCGTGSSAMGPFYCPADETAYFDVSFFDELSGRFGANTGPLAQEYVVAHEFGHHIQNLRGEMTQDGYSDTGPQGSAARMELQADCYAGLWAAHASTTDDESGQPFLKALTEQDISDALSAAEAVGDDTITERADGQVNPETWTHGSGEQRQKWFNKGLDEGMIGACNTWDVERV